MRVQRSVSRLSTFPVGGERDAVFPQSRSLDKLCTGDLTCVEV